MENKLLTDDMKLMWRLVTAYNDNKKIEECKKECETCSAKNRCKYKIVEYDNKEYDNDELDLEFAYPEEVSILGQLYTIEMADPEESSDFKNNPGLNGFCRPAAHRIVLRKPINGKYNRGQKGLDKKLFVDRVLRHEIVHAFLYESGLDRQTRSAGPWSANEEMVDWFAIQGCKIVKAWKEANCID